jgi:hypothetical protein
VLTAERLHAHLLSIESNLWLDALYLRHTTPRDGSVDGFVETVLVWSTSLWMTRVTIQGFGGTSESQGQNPVQVHRAVQLNRVAKVYAEGAKQLVAETCPTEHLMRLCAMQMLTLAYFSCTHHVLQPCRKYVHQSACQQLRSQAASRLRDVDTQHVGGSFTMLPSTVSDVLSSWC